MWTTLKPENPIFSFNRKPLKISNKYNMSKFGNIKLHLRDETAWGNIRMTDEVDCTHDLHSFVLDDQIGEAVFPVLISLT